MACSTIHDNNVAGRWDATTGKTTLALHRQLNPITKRAFYASASRGATDEPRQRSAAASMDIISTEDRQRSCWVRSSPIPRPVRRTVLGPAPAVGDVLFWHHRR